MSEFNTVHNIGSQTTHPSFHAKQFLRRVMKRENINTGKKNVSQSLKQIFLKESNRNVLSPLERNEEGRASTKADFSDQAQRTPRK